MVLILARRSMEGLYEAECFIHLPLAKALSLESDITTEMMKLDDTIIDCLVYSRREYSKDNIPSGLADVPHWYTPWWNDVADGVK